MSQGISRTTKSGALPKYLDKLLLYITDSSTLIIAVGPELPLDFVCPGQSVCPVHNHDHFLLAGALLGY